MEKYGGKYMDGRYNGYWKSMLVMLMSLTGCLADFQVIPQSKVKYALSGQNTTLVYTITSTDTKPEEIRVKVEVNKDTISTLFKITINNGKINKKIMNVAKGLDLERYKGRAAVEYKLPNVKLYLINVTNEDFGLNYIVEARDPSRYQDDGENEKQTELVQAVPPTIRDTTFFPRRMMIRGRDDTYICRADGTPPPYVKWMEGGRQKGAKQLEVSTMTIKNANTDDVKNYECIAENVGGIDKKVMSLTVAYIDYTDKGESSQVVQIACGGEINTECNIFGYPPIKYEWLDPSNAVIRSTRHLEIGNTKRFGNYTCEAENDAGTLKFVVHVKEIEVPKIDDSSFFPRTTVKSGDNEEFVCSASGRPPPKVKWITKDGRIVNGASLFLTGVGEDDAGEYICVAESSAGIANRTMTLIVSPLPPPPPPTTTTTKVPSTSTKQVTTTSIKKETVRSTRSTTTKKTEVSNILLTTLSKQIVTSERKKSSIVRDSSSSKGVSLVDQNLPSYTLVLFLFANIIYYSLF